MGLRALLPTRSWRSPGWGRMATSGGLPPEMAVPSTVGRASPLDWKLPVTPVFGWKASSTCWKLCCSVPDHTAQTVVLPPIFWLCWVVLVALGPLLPPQAASKRAKAPTMAPAALRPRVLLVMGETPFMRTWCRRPTHTGGPLCVRPDLAPAPAWAGSASSASPQAARPHLLGDVTEQGQEHQVVGHLGHPGDEQRPARVGRGQEDACEQRGHGRGQAAGLPAAP